MTSKEVKTYGLSLGYSKVGITSADGFPEYIQEVLSRGDAYHLLKYTTTNPLKDAMPQNVMPEAKSIIVLVWDYFQKDFPETLKAMIGKAYLGRCYGPLPGSIHHARFELMKDYLTANGCQVNSAIGVPARWAAAKAGVTTYGKNSFAYADGVGSYIIISTIVIDRELEYDGPTMECKCPPDCRACMEACPTKAIYEPFKIDPRRCISFNHWITQEGRAGISTSIPEDIRKSMGCRIHGCDICQDVCPRNQKKLKQPKEKDLFVEDISKDITLSKFLTMPEGFFEKTIHPILYNYIKDKRYLMRNAAVAMGNSKDPAYIPVLKKALDNSDAMIREHVTWALKEITGDDSAH